MTLQAQSTKISDIFFLLLIIYLKFPLSSLLSTWAFYSALQSHLMLSCWFSILFHFFFFLLLYLENFNNLFFEATSFFYLTMSAVEIMFNFLVQGFLSLTGFCLGHLFWIIYISWMITSLIGNFFILSNYLCSHVGIFNGITLHHL